MALIALDVGGGMPALAQDCLNALQSSADTYLPGSNPANHAAKNAGSMKLVESSRYILLEAVG